MVNVLIFDFVATCVVLVKIESSGKVNLIARTLVSELTRESRKEKYFW